MNMTGICSLAKPPFDDRQGDVVLRSADGVKFRLHKVILSKASSFFGRMFARASGKSSGHEEPQVLQLAEDARTVETLLAFIHPGIARPVFESFDDLCPILLAARRYSMPAVMTEIGHDLGHILRSGGDPMRAYGLACLSKREDVAREAAKRLLDVDDRSKFPPPSTTPEFRVLSCDHVFALAAYRRQSVQAALAVVRDKADDSSSPPSPRDDPGYLTRSSGSLQHLRVRSTALLQVDEWYICQKCSADDSWRLTAASSNLLRRSSRAWWRAYVRRVEEILAERPTALCSESMDHTRKAVDASLDEAALCSTCAPRARRRLMEFSQLLAGRVEEALNEVELQLPFSEASPPRNPVVPPWM